jgi:hypothetical protein
MISMRDTYIAFRLNERQGDKKIKNPKTLQIAVKTFLDLFTEQQRSVLEADVRVDEFFNLVNNKNTKTLETLDSPEDKTEANLLIKAFDLKNVNKIK